MFQRHSLAVLGVLVATATNEPDCSVESPAVISPSQPMCSELSPDIRASNGWRNVQASEPAEGQLFFTYRARPTVADLNGLLAVAPRRVDTFSDAPILVRFAADGVVDVRNGPSYDSDVDFRYEADVWYDIAIAADLRSQSYTVAIGRCGEQLTTLIDEASFRSDAPYSSQLTHWAVWSSQAAPLDVATRSWGAGGATGACQPSTCESLGRECGSWSDGCGGTVNCGSCAGGDVCVSGVCYDPGSTLEPENTQGDSWETIYEACTDDDYPSGYRPPLFVRPTMQNTGVNCPDKASGCPADATLTPLGFSTITSPGTYENFSLTGTLRIEANDVTIRNFEITCAGGFGIVTEKGHSNIRVEYGTVKKGATACTHVLVLTAGETYVTNVHTDQCGDDCIQSNGVNGPVMVERSLFTRPGDNGGYGSGAHADTWQYYDPLPNQHACWLGSRVVPSYCPNFYKNSNITQSGGPEKWYVYNNWLDQSTNVMVAGNGGIVRNNKFGNWRAGGGYWFSSRVTDMGGNVFECNGQPLSGGGSASPQPTCPWGFSNDPVTGWDGVSIHPGNSGPLDGQGNEFACSGTVDSQPIDPTEFCTSDGSGCVVTP